MRRSITIAALAAGLALSSAAIAGKDGGGPDRHGPGHGPHRGGPFMHELRDLDLSDAQREQIRGFFKTQREQDKTDRKAQFELHRSFELATPGTAQYQTLTVQLADAEATEARNRVQQMASLRTQVYGVLTPAQRTQLAEELAKRPEPPKPPEEN